MGATDRSMVSVVIPTYNRARYVPAAVESVLRQSREKLECLVIDDGSTDGTEEALRRLRGDSRLRYVRQENRGVAAARNRGIALSGGAYVAFLDSDDLWEPERLALQVPVLEALPEVGIVFSDFSAAYPDGRVDPSHVRRYFSVLDEYGLAWDDVFAHREKAVPGYEGGPPLRWGDIYGTMLFGNVVLTSTSLVRRGVFTQVGTFDESYSTLEDYDLFLRITRAYRAAYIDRPLVRYRYSEHQLSGEEHYGQLCENLITIFNRQVAGIEDQKFLRRNRRKLRRRLAEYQSRRAYFAFSRERMKKAASAYRECLKTNPAQLRAWVYLLLAHLPVGVTRGVRKIKSRLPARSAA